jgi:hypothetical protein
MTEPKHHDLLRLLRVEVDRVEDLEDFVGATLLATLLVTLVATLLATLVANLAPDFLPEDSSSVEPKPAPDIAAVATLFY